MRKLSIINAIVTVALFGGMTAAQAVVLPAHGIPSPCQNEPPAGPGATTDGCVFLGRMDNVYNATTGERSGTALPGSTITIDVFMDFTNDQTVGGGFDITYDTNAVDSVSFDFDPSFDDETIFRTNGPNDDPAGLYRDIGFGNFSGFGGEDDPVEGNPNPNPGDADGMQFIGTLTVALAAAFTGMTTFDFIEATDPPPEAPGPFSSNEGADQDVSFFAYNLTVVPLPGAVWLMLGGLGALFGFGRKKALSAASA